MSVNSNGTSNISQSMNGLSDVNATSITADSVTATTITADTVKAQNILAPVLVTQSNIYTTSTGQVNMGSLAGFINIGSSCPSVYLGNYSSTIKLQNITSHDSGLDTSLFANMNLASNLTISANRTGITNFYAGTNINLYTDAETISSISNLTKKILNLDNDGIRELYASDPASPSIAKAYLAVDTTGNYLLFCPKWIYNYGWDKYIIDGQSTTDTIIQSYYASSTNTTNKSATITVANGTTTDNQGDMTINSGSLTISGQTTINIGANTTTNNNIGSLTILNNKISSTGTSISLGDPLASGYSYPITAGFLGSVYTGSAFTTGTITPTGTFYTLSTLASVPIGNYMVTACVPFSSSGTGLLLTKINITITSEVTTPTPITTTHLNVNIPYTGAIPVASHSYPASTIMQLTAISTVNLNLSLSFTSGTYTRITTNGLFKLMRIA